MRDVIRHFPVKGEIRSCERVGTGHIHKTFLVETDAGERLILQKLNRRVFPDLDTVMANAEKLCAYLDAQGAALPMIRYLDARDGGKLYEDADGGTWRAYLFVPNSVCLRAAESEGDLFQAALAYGRFLLALRDFPAERLQESIHDFHNTPARYRQFRESLERDRVSRLREVEGEIAFALAREEQACALQRMREQGSLPARVTHNDAKLSNVLFDKASRAALCVIDLDTVMPGLAAFDFGDLVRSCGSATAEDAADSAAVTLALDRYRILLRGFLAGCPDLTQAERESLPLGAYTMTLECGLRFLSDYLDGDRYFAVDREKHNLYRARSQFALAADMERKWDAMMRVAERETG